jgi:hypothetical protein
MNCREFEDIVNDIARAKSIERSARADGLAHAEICARCAARLADERALSAGLRTLAGDDEGKTAPAGLEPMLLEAFRAQAKAPATILPSANPALWRSRKWPRMAWAAAAAILLVFGFILYRSTQSRTRKDDVVTLEKRPIPSPAVNVGERGKQDASEPQPRRKTRAPQRRPENRSKANMPFIRDSIDAYANDNESLSEFFSLNYGADPRPMESGELIRVQMPRSALVRFGLPVNVEHADMLVKADLLVGEDGLARAIRFVR